MRDRDRRFAGRRNPVDVLRESQAEYQTVASKFGSAEWSKPWQPGKWTAQQIMVHVMQWEMIMGVRLRLAVGTPDYTVQPADQDYLMGTEDRAIDGPVALATFNAVRKAKPAAAKGKYVRSIYVSSTMSPSIQLDSALAETKEA